MGLGLEFEFGVDLGFGMALALEGWGTFAGAAEGCPCLG